jgi:hypothetical protein
VRAAQRFERKQKCDPTQLVPNLNLTIAFYVHNKDTRDHRKISMSTTNFWSNMNNEAFQKMVRERAGVKTTKEIAREAVEAELFKGRGGGGGGKRRRPRDDYSSDEDADRPRRSTDRKQLQRSVESQDDSKPSESQSSQKYRDRALERRQGTAANVDIHGPQPLPEPRIASTAEAIFDDVVAAVESGDRRKLILLRKYQKGDTSSRPIATADEALAYIANPSLRAARPSGNNSNTEIGQAMLTYLREKYLPPPSLASQVSAAGRNIQRSQFTFTMIAHPSNVARSWEYPREDAAISLSDDNGWVPKATPCIDERLLSEMQQRLDRKNMVPTTKHMPPESKPGTTSPSLTEPYSLPIPSANGDKDNDGDDDDDDIFENVGDYDGKSAIQAMEEQETPTAAEPKTARPSIFASTTSSQHDVPIVQSTNRSVDAVSLDMARAEQGLASLSSYANDYDDDGIGMDFGGRDYDDEDDEDNDKKSSSKTKKFKSRKNRRERSPS